MPSDPNYSDSRDGKTMLQLSITMYVGNQVHSHNQKNQHQTNMLAYERGKRLNNSSLNTFLYVLHVSEEENFPSREIKQELLSWGSLATPGHRRGQKWKGTDFSDPEAFDVNDVWEISNNPAKKFMLVKDRICQLNVHQSDKGTESISELSSFDARLSSAPTLEQSVLTTEQKEKGKTTNRVGRQGGSTELLEEQLENGIETSTQRYKYSPHSVSDVGTEEVEGVQDSLVWESFTCTSPHEIGPISFYIFGIVFVFTGTVVLDYVQHKFSKWVNPKNSQKLASTMQEHCSLEKPSGEEQQLEGSATPQLLLEIFKSYQNQRLSNKKATYILVNFYNLSEVDALELLDE